MAFSIDWIKKPNGFLKVISFIISILVLVIFFHGLTGEREPNRFHQEKSVHCLRFIILVTPYNTFILFYWIVSYCIDNCKPGERAITETIYLVSQAIFFIIIAVFVLIRDAKEAQEYIYATVMIVMALLYLVDAFFTVLKKLGRGGSFGE